MEEHVCRRCKKEVEYLDQYCRWCGMKQWEDKYGSKEITRMEEGNWIDGFGIKEGT